MGKVNDAKSGGATTKRRGRLDIIAEILDASVSGALKTKIMYRANVNFVQFNDYAKCLLEARLMRTLTRKRKIIYETTEKGRLLLRRFNETEEIINAADGKEGNKPSIVRKAPMVYLVKK